MCAMSCVCKPKDNSGDLVLLPVDSGFCRFCKVFRLMQQISLPAEPSCGGWGGDGVGGDGGHIVTSGGN